MKLHLHVLEGTQKGERLEISESGKFTIGRSSECNFVIADAGVSRQHLVLELESTACYIRDNKSANGTYVKHWGEDKYLKVTYERVGDGTLIKIGNAVLEAAISTEDPETENLYCIRCRADITPQLETKRLNELILIDFLCSACRLKERDAKDKTVPKEKVFCSNCGGDVSKLAHVDGRAEQLKRVCIYLCSQCASKESTRTDEVKEYRLLKHLGQGGMGVVYKAWHKRTGRLGALKTILAKPHISSAMARKFQREMAVMSELVHPNIVLLLDQGISESAHFFVSEFMPQRDAESLVENVYKGPAPVKLASNLICQSLDGLDFAHSRGIVHRDIKPQNILLTKNEQGELVAKLGDFGLAKSFENAGNSHMTETNEYMGTMFYMAPEQYASYRYVKPQADIYSLGVSFYYLLCATHPWKGSKDPIRSMLQEEPDPILRCNRNVPESLGIVIHKAIQKDPAERFQTAQEFKNAIKAAVAE